MLPEQTEMGAEAAEDGQGLVAESTTEISDVVFTRTFPSPPNILFECWKNPMSFAQWWGPDSFTVPACEFDFQPGGGYRFVMRGADGTDHTLTGIFYEIIENERIVLTDSFDDQPEEDREEGDGFIKAIKAEFEPIPEGTKLVVTASLRVPEDEVATWRANLAECWEQSFNKMDNVLTKAD